MRPPKRTNKGAKKETPRLVGRRSHSSSCRARILRLDARIFFPPHYSRPSSQSRSLFFFSDKKTKREKETNSGRKQTCGTRAHGPIEMGLQGGLGGDCVGNRDGGPSPSLQSQASMRVDTTKRKTLESDSPASSGTSLGDADTDAAADPQPKRQRVDSIDDDNNDGRVAVDDRRDGIARKGRDTVRRPPDGVAPALHDPSEGMVAEWDCADLPLVRRWMRRMRKQFEAARCDAVWWQRAASALRPMPAEAGGGLLLVSAVLRGHPFSTPYEDLVKDVPDAVLEAVAWRGTRLIFGLCVHPDGCGPVASRPEGTPAHPHADRVLRLALTLPPDHEDRDADGNRIFTVGQVVHTIADLCGGNMAGRRLARLARLLARWYGNACAHWGEVRESIECFIERRVLLTARTGCTAADLVAGRLRPCDWLSGAPGPTVCVGQPLVVARDEGGKNNGTPPLAATEQQQHAGNDNARRDRGPDNRGICININAGDAANNDNISAQERAAAEHKIDLQEAQRRRRETPSLRCVYDRVVCKQPQAGRGLPCLYIQSRLCAAEDRPDA